MIHALQRRIRRLHAGQLALLWIVAGIVSTVAAWTIATAPSDYQRAMVEAASQDSEWDAAAAQARAAADSAREDLSAYYLIRAHEPHVFWPLLELDTMALSTERTAAKTARTMREIDREMLTLGGQLKTGHSWTLQNRPPAVR